MERAVDYDCEILYKLRKENVITDALSQIHINVLSSLLNSITQNAILKAYQKESFKDLIKETEEKKGTYKWYTIENKLLYYQTDEIEPWQLCLPDMEFWRTIIHENYDLPIAGHSRFVQTYSKITWAYYWPGTHKDIWWYTKECDACQRTKPST